MERPSFQELFGLEPTIGSEAPGRVNIIGEHTDYNGGYVLPATIPLRTRIELARLPGDEVRAFSANLSTEPQAYPLGKERRAGTWLDYVQGVTHILREAGHALGGCALRIDSTIPSGSGLSSSAALLVAVLRAMRAAFGLSLNDVEVAQLARRAENDFVGAPVGIMDQMVCSVGQEGDALFLDTQSMEYELVPLPRELELCAIDSGISHQHAGGEYAARRQECERAAALLGVRNLRQLGPGDLALLQALPPVLQRRARHVITEDERVLEAVRALRAHDVAGLGALMYAGHASLRDDFAVSLPELDLIVELARAERAVYGARLCGGGFGGVVVMIAAPGEGHAAASRIVKEYGARTGRPGAVLLPPRRDGAPGGTEQREQG